MGRVWVAVGSVLGALTVAMAAYAAHGLPGRLDAAGLHQVDGAVQMQAWHALALVACGIWARRGGRLAEAAGFALTLGAIAFCGAVYALAVLGLHLPGVAPAGGVLLMLGWLLLAASAVRAV